MKGTDRFFVDGITCQLGGEVLPVANLSVGGMFVATDTVLLVGQVLDLGLTLPQRPPFTFRARVSWVNSPSTPKAPDLPTGVGIQITRIGMAEKLAILDFLKRVPPALTRRPQA